MSAPRVAQIPSKKLSLIYRISFDRTTTRSLKMKIFPERYTVEDGSMLLGIKSHTDVLGKKKWGKKKRKKKQHGQVHPLAIICWQRIIAPLPPPPPHHFSLSLVLSLSLSCSLALSHSQKVQILLLPPSWEMPACLLAKNMNTFYSSGSGLVPPPPPLFLSISLSPSINEVQKDRTKNKK